MTADNLRSLIRSAGLTNSEAARRIGITPRSMRRMLAGTAPISPRTEIAAIAVFGKNPTKPEASRFE